MPSLFEEVQDEDYLVKAHEEESFMNAYGQNSDVMIIIHFHSTYPKHMQFVQTSPEDGTVCIDLQH